MHIVTAKVVAVAWVATADEHYVSLFLGSLERERRIHATGTTDCKKPTYGAS